MGVGGDRSSSKKRLTSNGSKKSKPSNGTGGKSPPKERNCMRMLSAILTRVLFALHSGIALWRVSFDYPKEYLYFLALGLVCLLFEMILTLAVRKGKEYKWFCPSVLFYLMSVIPCLWLLELSRFNGAMNTAVNAGLCNTNTSSYNTSSAFLQQIFMVPPNNVSVTNRTRRSAPDLGFSARQPDVFLQRARRQTAGADDSIRERKRRKERRRKLKTTVGEPITDSNVLTEAPKSLNGTEIVTENRTFQSNLTDAHTSSQNTKPTATSKPTPVTTRSSTRPIKITLPPIGATPLMTSQLTPVRTQTMVRSLTLTTSRTPTTMSTTSGGLDDLGQKIKDGFSNIEKETANFLNKTKEVIGQLDRWVDKGTWILLLHQVLLFVLVIGRWLLPKGEITRDQLSQLLLVFIGVGADILEFVTETIDGDELDSTGCSMILLFVIYAMWSWSLLQFTLVLTASKSRKTRVGFEAEYVVDTTKTGCCANSFFASADLWGILVTLFLQDGPFLATRLYILIVYNLKHQMMIFFTGKNALVVILQIYRIVVLKMSRKSPKDDAIDESEMEPLRGTLVQLARRATMVAENSGAAGDDIRDATFKRERDGSVVVKIHLEGEETLRRKRKKSAAAKSKT